MEKVMIVGKTGAGKTTLIQAMNNRELRYAKTQSIEYIDGMLDTPGEYLENKSYYRALTVSSVDYDIIMFLQPANEELNLFPVGFSNGFMSKKIIGVISKIDSENANTKRAVQVLKAAGAERIFKTSAYTGEGLEELKEYLLTSPNKKGRGGETIGS